MPRPRPLRLTASVVSLLLAAITWAPAFACPEGQPIAETETFWYDADELGPVEPEERRWPDPCDGYCGDEE